jgi:hypothetical protein
MKDYVRPKAPNELKLTKDEKKIWDTTLNSLPPKWVAEVAYPQLAQYCRVVAMLPEYHEWVLRAKRKRDGGAEVYKAISCVRMLMLQVKTLSHTLRLAGAKRTNVTHQQKLNRENRIDVRTIPAEGTEIWKTNGSMPEPVRTKPESGASPWSSDG